MKNLDESDRNVLLNVLNVLVRISDKKFILNYWGGIDKNYNSIILDCSDAIETLNDYCFFDLSTKQNLGEWYNYSKLLSNRLIKGLKLISKKIDTFENFNKSPNDLVLDEQWLEIMCLCNKFSKMMEIELGVENSKEYLI
ncbi:hypothetical protein IU405_02425 [Polaribacter sp. BAL334]|uniref:hypothetical protein n=1 Tax=Polaribacter sp. BAL334 TaxID=1708178 RepID=UPI0018D1F81A|nr:hypothetical protein [Polaribacter sp. BAL334]MBG7611094.1 hypothetical protein [Polaribacter sp. BAL334]